jgi:hypothetical protein
MKFNLLAVLPIAVVTAHAGKTIAAGAESIADGLNGVEHSQPYAQGSELDASLSSVDSLGSCDSFGSCDSSGSDDSFGTGDPIDCQDSAGAGFEPFPTCKNTISKGVLFVQQTVNRSTEDLYQICVKANKRVVMGYAMPYYTHMTGKTFVMKGNYAIKKGTFNIQIADPSTNVVEKLKLHKVDSPDFEFGGTRYIGKQRIDNHISAYYKGLSSYYAYGCESVLGN